MENSIKVSVCCIAFNQEKYIRQTLEGFINQKTNFDFEVLIHDDASTDGTAAIIAEYTKLYPDIIKPILQIENQYSKGIHINAVYNYPRAKGKYIAYCEGDDYWCDSQKLQKQYDALESHPQCSICVHKTSFIDRNGKKIEGGFPAVPLREGIISAEQYIHLELVENPWLFQTSSYFLRKEIIDNRYKHDYKYPVGDLPLVLVSLQFGDCYYIEEEMSCYRKDSGGVLTRLRDNNKQAVIHCQRMIEGHTNFDKYTEYKYHADFQYAIKFSEVQMYKLQAQYKRILQPEYRDVWERLNWKNHAIIYLGKYCPKLAFQIHNYFRKKNRNG